MIDRPNVLHKSKLIVNKWEREAQPPQHATA